MNILINYLKNNKLMILAIAIIILIIISISTIHKECYTTKTNNTTLVDKSKNCKLYGKRTEKLCKTNRWMINNCKKTCKPHNKKNVIEDKNILVDKSKYCHINASKNSCEKSKWTQQVCAKTCNSLKNKIKNQKIKNKKLNGILKISTKPKTKPKKSFLGWLSKLKNKKLPKDNKVTKKQRWWTLNKPVMIANQKKSINQNSEQTSKQTSTVKTSENVRSAKLKKQRMTGSATHYNLWCANGDECVVPRNKMFGSGGLYGTNCDPNNPEAGWVLQDGKWTCNKKPDHGKHIGDYIMENDMLRTKNDRLTRNNTILRYKLNPKKKYKRKTKPLSRLF